MSAESLKLGGEAPPKIELTGVPDDLETTATRNTILASGKKLLTGAPDVGAAAGTLEEPASIDQMGKIMRRRQQASEEPLAVIKGGKVVGAFGRQPIGSLKRQLEMATGASEEEAMFSMSPAELRHKLRSRTEADPEAR